MKLKTVVLSLAMLSLMSFFVLAEENSSNGVYLDARYSHAACKVELATSQATNMAKYTSAAGLSEASDKLKADLATLKGFADAKDKEQFNAQLKTMVTDAKDLNEKLKGARAEAKKVSKDKKLLLIKDWKASMDAYKTCNSESVKDIANATTQIVDKDIEKLDGIIAQMDKQKMDTTELKSLLAQAKEYRAAVEDTANAASPEEVKKEAQEVRNLHFHLMARTEIARIEAYVGKLELISKKYGIQDKLASIKEKLDKASEIAQPGHKYTEEEYKAVWDNIKEAGKELKDLIKDLKSQAKANAE